MIKETSEKYLEDIRYDLFLILAVTTLVAGVIAVVMNTILHGVGPAIINSLICTSIMLALLAYGYFTKKTAIATRIILLIVVIVQFPMLLLFTGKNAMPYFMYALFVCAMFSSYKYRVVKFFGLLAYYIFFIFLSQMFPNLAYDEKDSFTIYSSVITLVIAAVSSFLLLSVLLKKIKKQYDRILEQGRMLEEKNEQLERLSKEAIDANKAKSLFLAQMSHEIRTPINSIIGMNEMILRESTEADVRKYANIAGYSSKSLLEIVNDILDISKIESGKMELVPVKYELKQLIVDLVRTIGFRAESKGLELKIKVEETLPNVLYGDDVRIRQIILNILTNAVKYTKRGTVTLNVSGQKENDCIKLLIKVADTGIGISKENIAKLFDEYERFDKEKNRDIEGTGLGITIVNKLLSLMDSKLQVESEYGKGSCFSFELLQRIVAAEPVGSIEEHLKAEDSYVYRKQFEAPDAKVLVVDDNEINRMVFTYLLKETGVQIKEAASGYECLDMIKDEHFDVIFMDHMMPGIDGIETLRKIREDKEHSCQNVPVLALTANALSGSADIYMVNGFEDVIIKPLEPYILEKKLKDILRNHLVPIKEVSA